MPVQPFVQLWIWISAFATLAGWTLSAFGELNRVGYAVAFAIFAVFVFLLRRDLGFTGGDHFSKNRKYVRRFRRPLPFCFLVLAVLIFISGAIYPPNNYTALTYRFPRALQWLAHGRWFWIHTANYRMNDRACGIEWLSAPLLLFTKSTRFLFLLNFVPFLLLPGLTFSVLTRLGVRQRVAWQWMWLLPTGYNFLLQAGSATNDVFPAVYALAAIDFALRARRSKRFSEASNSILSAALLTGAKASNLPLLLPWAILIVTGGWWQTAGRTIMSRAARLVPVVIIAAAISFLPTAILNSIYCGDWSGAVLEPPIMTVKNPLIAFSGNAFQLILDNFSPPFFPQAAWWNEHATKILPQALVSISKYFDTGFFTLGELPTEDGAGIGLGLSVLLAASVLAKFFVQRTSHPLESRGIGGTTPFGKKFHFCVLIAPWLALLAYCVKSGMTGAARLIAPYYALLLPLLLVGVASSRLVRLRLWRFLVLVNMVLAFGVLILTPPRPMWPAQTILSRLVARHPDSHLLARALKVYSLYSTRSDSLAAIRKLLPENISVVGFAGGADDAEISLWLPLGSRRVEDFLVTDPMAQIRKQGIEYAVIGDIQLQQFGVTIDDWLKKNDAELLATADITLKIATGKQTFYVIKFRY